MTAVPELLVLLALTLAAMTVHAVVGFGFAQFVAPVLLLTHSGLEAVSSLLLLALLVNTLIVAEGVPAHFRRGDLAILVPGALVGLPLGALVIATIDEDALQALVGVAILLAAALQLRRHRPRPIAGRLRRDALPATAAGALSGVLTTATAIGAAPVILWLERRVADGAHLRHGIALYSIFLCAVGVALLVLQSGGEAATGALLALTLAPAVFVGHALGRRAFGRLSNDAYRKAVLALVIVAGAASIVGALA